MPFLNAPEMKVESKPEAQPTNSQAPSVPREAVYARHFSTAVKQTGAANGFFQQVSGFGVQLFSQASFYGRK